VNDYTGPVWRTAGATSGRRGGNWPRRCRTTTRHSRLPPPTRRIGSSKQQAQFYGEQALALLHTAVARGFKDAAHMQKDIDLDPLRGRDDFQKLLAELDKGAGKGKPSDDRPRR
jgi:hypothetical protein